MKTRLGLKLQLMTLAVTFCCSMAATAGGLDGGGNGFFVRIPGSQRLVLWDLLVNSPSFSEDQSGDQIRLQPVPFQPQIKGEWIDYRKFKSFAYLKSRLALWSKKAPNLYGLLDEDGFAEGSGSLSYRVLLIATRLYIQSVDEISVPAALPIDKLKAYPSAYFDVGTGRVFLNLDLWNGAGLISQAAMLLHERMRGLQMGFYLSNDELQRAVYTILLVDPSRASIHDLDDSHFSKSWIALHTTLTPKTFDTAFGNIFDASVRGAIFDCEKALDPKACVQRTLQPFAKGAFPPIEPLSMSVANSEIEEAAAKNILGMNNPGPFSLISKGTRNGAAPALPTGAYFSKMYGVYAVVGCKDKSVRPPDFMKFCDYSEFWIFPNKTNPMMTIASLRQYLSTGGVGFATVGSWNPQPSPNFKYSEVGDTFASAVSSFSNQFSDETTMKKLGDSVYVLKMKVMEKADQPSFAGYDYEYELTLRKK